MARADLSIVPERLNPELTPELEQEVRFFQKWGYLVVDDAIAPEEVEILSEAMDDADCARDRTDGTGSPTRGRRAACSGSCWRRTTASPSCSTTRRCSPA